jgi:hypothetical protein
MIRLAPAFLVLSAFCAPALAASGPPTGAKPLSQIVASLEARPDFSYVDEIEWDSGGYWKVEYVTRAGAEVTTRLDPASGAERPR